MVLATLHFLDDRRARALVGDAAARFTMDQRRPIEMEMIGYAPSADFASQVFASSVIGDALGTKRLTGLSPDERRAWLDVPLYLDEELAAAIELQLAAMRRNPGWPLHRYFLGKVAYTRERRSLGSPVDAERWFVPLESAWRNAPDSEPSVETLAGVILEAWRLLPEEKRAIAADVLGAALVDPRFVNLAFDVAVDVIGRDVAFDVLPDHPGSLLAAARTLGRRGDVAGAAIIYERWEDAEWDARSRDLETMRIERATGDLRGLLSAAATWASRHDVHAFDSKEALEQAAEVLRLWPMDQVGAWGSDPRGEIVRFFLDGRLASADLAVLDATVSSISNTPAPVRARVALASGSVEKAESILARAGNEGAFEWTSYFVDLATRAIERNDLDGAIQALGRISPSARGECDVVVVRRRAGEEIEPPDIAVREDDGRIVDEAWSANGMLGFCVDPTAWSSGSLTVELDSTAPVLLEWGLNTGRRDTILVDGPAQIELPLDGLSGRNVLYTKVLWGEGNLDRRARVREP
jgi:hypothetical protein